MPDKIHIRAQDTDVMKIRQKLLFYHGQSGNYSFFQLQAPNITNQKGEVVCILSFEKPDEICIIHEDHIIQRGWAEAIRYAICKEIKVESAYSDTHGEEKDIKAFNETVPFEWDIKILEENKDMDPEGVDERMGILKECQEKYIAGASGMIVTGG